VASDEERLARELAEQLKLLRVEDVVVQTLVTVSSIGYRCLGLTEETRDARDLAQAQRAIAVMQALTPVLGTLVPPEAVRDFESAVANLQLAYASAAVSQPPKPGEKPHEAPRAEPEAQAQETPEAEPEG
jgi:hypothetical protein